MRLKSAAVALLSAIVAGVVAAELSTTYTNPHEPFWQARGAGWAGMSALALLSIVGAKLLMSGPWLALSAGRLLHHLVAGALASSVLLVALAIVDADPLLLTESEIAFAILFGLLAGFCWYIFKRIVGKSHG